MPESDTLVDLLRHGETVTTGFNGRTDVPLSPVGYAQMEAAVKGRNWDRVIYSPLERCRVFARDLARDRGIPSRERVELIELDFGDWEGLTGEAVAKRYPKALDQYWREPALYTPHAGEAITSLYERGRSLMNELTEIHGGEHLLLVTHAVVIRTLLIQVLSMSLNELMRIEVDYACFSRIRIPEKGKPSLVFHGQRSPC